MAEKQSRQTALHIAAWNGVEPRMNANLRG